MALFALDQGFPQPIVKALEPYLLEARLVALAEVDPRLSTLEDWEVLLALKNHAEPWDGLITTDSAMVRQARELSVLHQTQLTLVVAEAAGHDPVKASGLVLAHLPSICKRTRPDLPQVWILRTVERSPERPWKLLTQVASHQHRPVDELFAKSRLSDADLGKNPIG